MKTIVVRAGLAAALFGTTGLGSAWAGSATQSFDVTLTITASCTLSNATAVTFNEFTRSATAPPAAQTARLTYSCTPGSGITPTIAFSGGTDSSNTADTVFAMKNLSNAIDYSISYGGSLLKNGGTPISLPAPSSEAVANFTVAITNTLDQLRALPAGKYTDTVTATLTYN